MIRTLLIAAGLTVAAAPLAAQTSDRPARGAQQPGILDQTAPSWGVEKWLNLPEGTTSIDIADYQGKVVYLYGFQSWCPGCHSHGFPTMQRLIEAFAGNDDVAFVAVQTVFEGYQYNTFDHARRIVDRYALTIPVGQSGENGRRSPIMRNYRTGGTPWVIVIDRNGVVRYNDFRIDGNAGIRLIRKLLAEPVSTPAATLPVSAAGQTLLGQPLALDGLQWADGAARGTPGDVVLVRWFTDGCHHCAFSMPAIEALRTRYAKRGFRTLAIFHPKPAAAATTADAVQAARAIGYQGDVAVDADWAVLKRIYLDAHRDSATSVSFLLDRRGRVQFVHPGPALGPSDTADRADANSAYQDLVRAIEILLDERRPSP